MAFVGNGGHVRNGGKQQRKETREGGEEKAEGLKVLTATFLVN